MDGDGFNNKQGMAFGSPGIPPKWTSSQKDGIGTAYSAASRVWFTISHGILNEIYYPTIDRPQIRDMQFLITDGQTFFHDGQTFFHEEKRDLDNSIACIERDTLGYRIESSDRDGHYRVIKEIIGDPHQPCVLIHAGSFLPRTSSTRGSSNWFATVFAAQATLRKAELKVRVGIKEIEDPVPLCYCFEYGRADIRRDVEELGSTKIPDEIKAEIQGGFCACEVKNPSGSCCLGDITRAVHAAKSAEHVGAR